MDKLKGSHLVGKISEVSEQQIGTFSNFIHFVKPRGTLEINETTKNFE
jgi:hypothetical protein